MAAARLRGRGPQKRCPCPLHRGDNRGRSFSVNLDDNLLAQPRASETVRGAEARTLERVQRSCREDRFARVPGKIAKLEY